ncbi:OmpA family protein [Methylophilus rhizosphaerae]|uniref:OmpA family protein n=1 Tax=Methylophilus rhizosphaerae TaxID=492660 RepID=UPI000B868C97|nr:OmpA family protein [Methylophilus rhizosphaerae]
MSSFLVLKHPKHLFSVVLLGLLAMLSGCAGTGSRITLLPEVLQVVRARLPTEVTVFGYDDAAGKPDYNLALSARRANAVAELLRKMAPDLPVNVQYFGDKAPLIPTPPGVPEPRNRRAEIFVL